MKFIATFHHAYNWWFFGKDQEFDTVDPAAQGLYSRRMKEGELPDEKYLRDWYDQIIEVIEMLGGDGAPLNYFINEDGLSIEVPEKVPSPVAVCFKVTTRNEL